MHFYTRPCTPAEVAALYEADAIVESANADLAPDPAPAETDGLLLTFFIACAAIGFCGGYMVAEFFSVVFSGANS